MANEFLPLATGGGSNVITQAAYDALAARLTGFQAGVAKSGEVNKAIRQATSMAAMLGRFVGDYGNLDALDDGNIDNLVRDFARSIQAGEFAYVVATGTANQWVVAPTPAVAAYAAGRVLWIRAPATNTSATVTANVSELGARAVKKADGANPAVGDLVINRWYPTLDDGANIVVVQTLPSDVAAQKALVNLQTRITSTRQNMVGDAGNSYTVTAWTPTAYVKQSPTSKLVLWLAANSLTPGSAGASAAQLTVGAATPIESVASNAQPATSAGPTVIQREILGLAAGSHSLALAYRRYDATAWNTVFCPTSADVGYLPATSTAILIIGEVAP